MFVEDEPKRMHWMLEGQWYNVDYNDFAALLGCLEDLEQEKIHSEGIYPPERLAYMYRGGSVMKVNGLHPTYRYLDRMFRKTIDCKGGDKGNIADYSTNLLHRMSPGAQSFSFFDFILSKIGVLVRGPSRAMDLHPTSCL